MRCHIAIITDGHSAFSQITEHLWDWIIYICSVIVKLPVFC